MKKFALITDEGTAADETCLCEVHLTDANKDYAFYVLADDDVKDKEFQDVSENHVCKCFICGSK